MSTTQQGTTPGGTPRGAAASGAPSGGALALLQDRVDAFSRYADLVTAQLTALDEADLDAFALLADHRDALASEIDAGPALADLMVAPGAAPSPDSDTNDELLARAQAELTRAAAAAHVVDQSLQTMRLETHKSIQYLDSRAPALRRYLETDGTGGTTVDISL